MATSGLEFLNAIFVLLESK